MLWWSQVKYMARGVQDPELLAAALEGLEAQKKRIEDQISQVRALLGRRRGRPAGDQSAAAPAPKRQLSPAARKRIAAAQKRRWAEYRKKAGGAGRQG